MITEITFLQLKVDSFEQMLDNSVDPWLQPQTDTEPAGGLSLAECYTHLERFIQNTDA